VFKSWLFIERIFPYKSDSSKWGWCGDKQQLTGGGGGDSSSGLKLRSTAQHSATDASLWRKSGDPLGIPALPPKPQYGAASAVPQSQTRPITSGSEFSDDDDHEIDLSQNMNPRDEKRVRRYGTLALSFKRSCI
jgi:hypothetical protein